MFLIHNYHSSNLIAVFVTASVVLATNTRKNSAKTALPTMNMKSGM